MHARTGTRTHTRTHARTHAHTGVCASADYFINVGLVSMAMVRTKAAVFSQLSTIYYCFSKFSAGSNLHCSTIFKDTIFFNIFFKKIEFL